MQKLLLLLLVCTTLLLSARASEPNSLEFMEAFAWGDRDAAVRTLVPNTEDFYFYSALRHQLAGDPTALAETQKNWLLFLGNGGKSLRYNEIERRQKLLDFNRNPDDAWEMIVRTLNLRFAHRPQHEQRVGTVVAALNSAQYSRDAFMNDARRHRDIESAFTQRGMDIMRQQDLTPTQRRFLLGRLQHPDVADLVTLIIGDLNTRDSRGFGQHPIHRLLTRAQLEELGRRQPALLRDGIYVNERLARIPAPDTDLAQDHAAAAAYFGELWEFAQTLEAMHNSLKASVLYRLLDHQRHLGIYNEQLLRSYLELPRQVNYLARERRQHLQNTPTQWVNFNYQPDAGIVLPPIGNEEPLVRDFLLQLLRDAANTDAYSLWFETSWLNAIFAESKILHGIGTAEQWANLLTPAQYRAILERVELDFALTNARYLKVGQPVQLQVDVKRIDTVLVKIYELQTFTYYSSRRQAVDQAVDLDGLVATYERTLDTRNSPGRRVRYNLHFPEISRRGVYVVELIGGGVSSRALLHVGHLESISVAHAAGQVIMVLNEAGEHVRNAKLWLDGREFSADANGIILLPYSENPGLRFMVLRDGNFSHPDQLQHLGEDYSFAAGIHLDPQNLPRRRTATLSLRPDLRIHGIPVDLSVLQDVKITLGSTDARGTRSERHYSGEFQQHKEWTTSFYVPDDLRRLDVRVEARINRRRDAEPVLLSDSYELEVNGARRGAMLHQAFLVPSRDAWHIEVRGLTGEAIAATPLNLQLFHPGFNRPLHFAVSTDADGRVKLGDLAGIARISISGPGVADLSQTLVASAAVIPARMHLQANEPVSLPWPFAPEQVLRAATLLRVDRGKIQEDMAARITIADGQLRIAGLGVGEYQLLLHPSAQELTLVVGDGERRHGYLIGARQRLQETAARLPSLAAVQRQGEQLQITLRHRTASTRVAVRLARYAGGGEFPPGFGYPAAAHRRVYPPHVQYINGRNIGDEYRYVLERRQHESFAGSLLERPGLILNPWELREVTAEREHLKQDQAYRGGRQKVMSAMGAGGADARSRPRQAGSSIAGEVADIGDIGFDFLPQGSQWLLNLLPDANDQVVLELDSNREHTFVDIIIIDRFGSSRYRQMLPNTEFEPVDVRLLAGLNPKASFSRQKSVRTLAADEVVTFADLATSRYQVIADFAQAYDLLRTLGGHAELDEFAFVKQWPKLDAAAKREKYGQFASHELHLFLYARDRDFFTAVVQPYLRNKKDKTFIDRWLLEELTVDDLRLDRLQQRNALELALLARRGGDAAVMQAALRDAWELQVPDPDALARIVRVALQAADLDETVATARDQARTRAEAVSPMLMASEQRRAASGAISIGGGVVNATVSSPAVAAMSAPMADSLDMGMREGVLAEAESMPVTLGVAFADFDAFGAAAPLFRALPKTKEWAEQNYYKVRMHDDVAGRIEVNEFWLDFAAGKLLSANLLQAHATFTEAIVALAFSALPWEAGQLHETPDAAALTLISSTAALLVSEQILPAAASSDSRPLLLSQQFFRPDDRYRYDGNEQVEKFITGEFIRHTVYGARVTLTNPTASRRRFNVLMQIPRGAVPVLDGFYTDDQAIVLESYTTRVIEYFFIFPFAGEFAQFPAHAAADEVIIGSAAAQVFNVVDTATEFDRTSWTWLAQHGESAEVLQFLQTNNLRRLDLDEMAWRLRDQQFFAAATDILASRLVLHDTSFSYAIFHRDAARARIWLPHSRLAGMLGPVLDTPLLMLEPVQRRAYEHLEYDPLVNARVHPLGQQRRILNPGVDSQYRGLLAQAIYRPGLPPAQRLALVYFLLLQDRLGEARTQLAYLRPQELEEKLQLDYLQAWLAMRTLELDQAQALAAAHLEHPVPRWRQRFAALHDAVVAARGDAAANAAADASRQQALDHAASASPSLLLRHDGAQVLVTASNLPRAMLNIYPMDIELLFSRRPFLADASAGFGIVKPALSIEIDLQDNGEEFALELPAAFRDRNMVLELEGGGLRESIIWYANRLRVRMMPQFGQIEIRAAADNQPVPRAYVKVFARSAHGVESFWKDGYTDARGRFDYVSLNDRKPEEAAVFSILIMHDEHGALIRDATPPPR